MINPSFKLVQVNEWLYALTLLGSDSLLKVDQASIEKIYTQDPAFSGNPKLFIIILKINPNFGK